MARESSPPRRRNPRYAVPATGVVLVGAVAFVGLIDPHRRGSPFPPCPFRLLTGWNCPACGGLRMVHDLLHADLAAAVADNVFLLSALPALACWVLVCRRLGRPVFTAAAVSGMVGLLVTWTVVRNLPGFPLVPIVLDG
jgi:Protein of unknown function (DUF2752)